MTCTWCLEDHNLRACPKAAALRIVAEHGVIDPMAADDVNDQLALRMIRERVAKGAYRKLCLDAGTVIPDDVLLLDPDRGLYA
jgi:hypothetical protein